MRAGAAIGHFHSPWRHSTSWLWFETSPELREVTRRLPCFPLVSSYHLMLPPASCWRILLYWPTDLSWSVMQTALSDGGEKAKLVIRVGGKGNCEGSRIPTVKAYTRSALPFSVH